MNKIEVKVLDSHNDPGGMMMFLAKLTQRGHNINSMADLEKLMESSRSPKASTVESVAALPHGTIKRFCPITVAIVGASRRFLAQARTHQVGFNYVSASLQYSNYSDKGQFVVPYALMKADHDFKMDASGGSFIYDLIEGPYTEKYLEACNDAMETYKDLAKVTDNDTAGYAAPQGLRNILIIQANHEAWMNFIRLRSCNRNTNETQYVTLRIWEELLKTPGGKEMFKMAGPDCMWGACREGKMCCGKPLRQYRRDHGKLIKEGWPLLCKEK